MKEPKMQEVLELVEFERNAYGVLHVKSVKSSVWGNVEGAVYGDVYGDVEGDVKGYVGGKVKGYVAGHVGGSVWGCVWGGVYGDVKGDVSGTIKGREWKFVETPKEKVARLIREGKGEEAIKVLEKSEL
jgi:hypothetical protein